jgi:CheY-like chemotaxis protein
MPLERKECVWAPIKKDSPVHHILLVDDSAVDRQLLAGFLKRDVTLLVHECTGGRQALRRLAEHPPDVVVTDMLMPEMDGLELVKAIRAKHPELPVVLVTAHGSETLAASALREGAAGYVAKANCKELLAETIHHVLELSHAAADYERLLGTVKQNYFEFELPSDPSLIPPLQDLAQRIVGAMGLCDATGRLQVGVALEHAVTNAMYHGNLELSGDELATVRGAQSAQRCKLLGQRKTQSPYCDRRVQVTMQFSRAEAIFRIRDQGPGFDVGAASTADLATFFRGTKGQGLFLMWAFMDKISFDKTGNTVTLQKLREPPRAAAPSAATTSPAERPPPPPALLARLIAKDDPDETYSLRRRRITIGRDDSCDVAIHSSSVSHHHCVLYVHEGWWYVKDLESTNGTKVNYSPVSEHLVRPGDTLTIGKVDFDLQYQPHELGAVGITPPVDPF